MSDQPSADHPEAELPATEAQPAERQAEEPAVRAVRRPVPFTQLVGRVVLGAVAVLFLVFSLFNRHAVTFDWVFGQWRVSLIVLLLGSFLLGVLVSSGWSWRRKRLRSARVRQDEGES